MKILIVCSRNSGNVAPFITDQVTALENDGIICDYFYIHGKGFWGYLKNRKRLLTKIKEFCPSLIHAHYGLSGLLANTQRMIPVITTYHGSDINNPQIYWLSRLSMKLSKWNIFVSQKNIDKSGVNTRYSLIPCGVDMSLFKSIDKNEARKALGLNEMDLLVLFAGSFSNKVKNPELAIESVKQFSDVKLIELKGYSREQVSLLMNAVDACLMTSFTEGSPQFIKEAMACNCPIVSVNVGDVEEFICETKGCYICSYNESEITAKLKRIFSDNVRTDGRKRIIERKLSSDQVSNQLIQLYSKILKV